MKSKHLLVATLLLSQTAPVWGMNGMNDDVAQDRGAAAPHRPVAAAQPAPERGAAAVALLRNKIQDMNTAVDQTLATARAQAPNFYDNKVFVIGETGHGKTTLLHAIAGVNFNIVANRNGRGLHLEVPDNRRLPGTQLGHGRVVGTTAPAVVPDQGRQTVFVDCLGFGDPRGPILDTANALGIKRLFSQGTRAKALLVIEEDKLATLRDDFVPRLLNQVAASFPDGQMLNSIRLVVTKASANYLPQIDLEDWKRHAQMGNQAKLLIDSLLQPNRIFKFLAPTNAQRFDGFDVNEFSRVLGQDGYTLNPQVTPVLTPASKLLIGDMVDEIREEGRRYLTGTASDQIKTMCDNMVNDNTNPHRTIGALRTDLRALRNNVRNLQTLTHFKDAFHQIIGDNDVSGRRLPGQPQLVRGLVQNVEFLKELHPTVNTPQDSWRAALAPIAGSIEALAANPQVTEAHGILSIKGRLLSTEDLAAAKVAHPNTTFAKMFASNTTLGDTSIQHKNFSIAVYSPKFNVVKPTVINIRGRDGDNVVGQAAVGQPGGNGGHGAPGAHFLAKVREARGLNNLTVLANGGNGGSGGQGGPGHIGANGNLDQATHHQRSTGLLPYGWGCNHGGGFSAEGHWIGSDDLRHQLDLRYTQILYNALGTAGSNGGNGGQGGQGAPGGSARIIGGVAWAAPAANVADGGSGIHGYGGNAGYNGANCVGEDHINRRLAYQALVGKNGFMGLGTGIYADRFIELPNNTITARHHVGGRATSAGIRPTAPHGNVPSAIPAIDVAALDAEYALFHAAELANQDARRFVRDLP